MTDALPVVLHRGAGFPLPVLDRWHPPHGEVRWLDAEPVAVSTSGPCLALTIDLSVPRAAGREQIVVIRVRDDEGYLTTGLAEWQDPYGHLAITATVPLDASGAAEGVSIALPYAAFPPGVGGALQIEVAVHEPAGPLSAHARFDVDAPEDVERVPDLLTVTAHTLVALVQTADGGVSREEARVIEALLCDDFQLDDVGQLALARILKTAAAVDHTPEGLAQVLGYVMPESMHERFVNLLYACARADGLIQDSEQAFVDELLAHLHLHDHQRFGPEALRACWDELELEPGATLAEVRAAYKRLVRDYHPDRVEHLARGFREYATEKTAALNEAYAALKAALSGPLLAVVELDETSEVEGTGS